MGRSYAGILGPLAMATVLLRGVKDGSAADETLWLAIVALMGFGLVGALSGWLAQLTVDESVRTKMEEELAAAASDAAAT